MTRISCFRAELFSYLQLQNTRAQFSFPHERTAKLGPHQSFFSLYKHYVWLYLNGPAPVFCFCQHGNTCVDEVYKKYIFTSHKTLKRSHPEIFVCSFYTQEFQKKMSDKQNRELQPSAVNTAFFLHKFYNPSE